MSNITTVQLFYKSSLLFRVYINACPILQLPLYALPKTQRLSFILAVWFLAAFQYTVQALIKLFWVHFRINVSEETTQKKIRICFIVCLLFLTNINFQKYNIYILLWSISSTLQFSWSIRKLELHVNNLVAESFFIKLRNDRAKIPDYSDYKTSAF